MKIRRNISAAEFLPEEREVPAPPQAPQSRILGPGREVLIASGYKIQQGLRLRETKGFWSPRQLLFFFFIFYCCSVTVVCIFSPPLHPTPAKLTSLPSLHPPLWFCHRQLLLKSPHRLHQTHFLWASVFGQKLERNQGNMGRTWII